METYHCDVLVVGSGIAGVTAAIRAARGGASVCVASLGDTFSGSSFYGGTWGLGLVGPLDEDAAQDCEQTILKVGSGAANPQLVHALVRGVNPAIAWLEGMGMHLRVPQDQSQQAYIPCFDHKTRGWHGLERDSMRTCFARQMRELGVCVLGNTELVDIAENEGVVAGAYLADHARGSMLEVRCRSIVLASGGMAGLYQHRLTPADNCASVHGIALRHGCRLVNTEFMQIMPAMVAPVEGIVVNEKAFRYALLPYSHELLDERSGYGPFTSRLGSHALDLAIHEAGADGMPISYRLPSDPPELVATYFDWLERDFGIAATDAVRIGLFAHASNGGIAIDESTACTGGPAGLFACGECAGGVHGADRIGGLASAAALVFGLQAGKAASEHARDARRAMAVPARQWIRYRQDEALMTRLRALMDQHALVNRNAEGLREALDQLAHERERLIAHGEVMPSESASACASGHRASNQLLAASTMLTAMLRRTESRGSHHRIDHPGEDAQLAHAMPLGLDDLGLLKR